MRQLILIVIIGSLTYGLVYGQLSGPLSGTLGPGIFTVIGDISVEQNDSLTIMPRTELLFNSNCEFFIRGRLTAVGEVDDSIKFIRATQIDTWEGIDFPSLAVDSKLEYCIISGSDDRGLNITNLSMTIKNCTISDNDYFYGGGIYCSNAELLLENSIICNNTASDGGGIYITNESNATIKNCEFLNNSADQDGGSLYCEEFDSLNIINSSFIGNTSGGHGGGLYITEGRSLLMESCVINNNIAQQEAGGGIIVYGVYNSYFVGCEISDNISEEYGGGLAFNWSEVFLRECTIDNNSSGSVGGGLSFFAFDNLSLDMYHCIISNNSAESGGGLYVSDPDESVMEYCLICGNYAEEWGGGIYAELYAMDMLIKNCTISDNQADMFGGGIYGTCYPYSNSELIIQNSILWDNIATQIEGNRNRILYSDIQGGFAGQGNINANPLFIDPVNGNYYLSEQSPCIDAGDPTSPLDPDSTIADMGAFYYDQTPPGLEDLIINISGNDIVIDWNDIPNAEFYNVYRSDEPYFDFSTLTAIANPATSGFIDYGAVDNGPYYYCVTYEINLDGK